SPGALAGCDRAGARRHRVHSTGHATRGLLPACRRNTVRRMPMAERVPGLRVLVALGIVALALHILQLLALPFRLEQVFIVAFTAVLIAAAVAPAASALERRRVPRGITVLLVYLAALLLLSGVVALIVPLVADEVDLLHDRLPEYNEQLKDLVA